MKKTTDGLNALDFAMHGLIGNAPMRVVELWHFLGSLKARDGGSLTSQSGDTGIVSPHATSMVFPYLSWPDILIRSETRRSG
jgi:hypothetical protein